MHCFGEADGVVEATKVGKVKGESERENQPLKRRKNNFTFNHLICVCVQLSQLWASRELASTRYGAAFRLHVYPMCWNAGRSSR